jgi:hypothetical protein
MFLGRAGLDQASPRHRLRFFFGSVRPSDKPAHSCAVAGAALGVTPILRCTHSGGRLFGWQISHSVPISSARCMHG